MSAQTASSLIDRTTTDSVNVDDFLSGRIDYRTIRGPQMQAKYISDDYESLRGQASLDDLDNAIEKYLFWLCSEYPQEQVMGFTGASKWIDRSQLPDDPRLINIDDFVGLRIDYRGVGTIREQESRMTADHNSVAFRAHDRALADEAFGKYLKLIRHNYTE